MRIFVTQPIGPTALERLRGMADVKVNPDSSRILDKKKLDRWRAQGRHPVFPAA